MRAALRGIHELNALNDTAGITDDVRFYQSSGTQNKRRKFAYPPPTSTSDRTIVTGEILVTRKAIAWTPGTMEEPKVRSVLNGMTFTNKTGNALEDLKSSIRPVGAAKKTVKYDASRPDLDPSDDPVAVLFGHMTTVNSGEEHIELGDMVQTYLVPVDTTNQYKDGVNIFSPNRIIMGTRPLRMDHTFKDAYKNNPELKRAIQYAIKKHYTSDEAAKAAIERFESLLNDGNPKIQRMLNGMLHALRAHAMSQLNRYVGVASTGADVGEKMNVVIQPLPNVVSRGRPAIPSS